MIVCTTLLYIAVLLIFHVETDVQNVTVPSRDRVEHRTKEVWLQQLLLKTYKIKQKKSYITEIINQILQQMKRNQESIDKKFTYKERLSKRLQMTMSLLRDMIGQNLTTLEIQSNLAKKNVESMIDKKEHSEGITSTIIRSISHQSETLAHDRATLQSYSSTILKERQSLDHQLSHLEEQLEGSTSSISESINHQSPVELDRRGEHCRADTDPAGTKSIVSEGSLSRVVQY